METIMQRGNIEQGISYTLDNEGVLTLSGKGRLEHGDLDPDRSDLDEVSGIDKIYVYYSQFQFFKPEVRRLVIEEGITELAEFSIRGEQLEVVVLPNSITKIEANAISFCPNLRTIVFPKSLRYVEKYIIYDCPNLSEETKAQLEARQPKVVVIDGVCYKLYDDTMTAKIVSADYYGMKDYEAVSGKLVIPSEIDVEGLKYAVVEIDYNALDYLDELTAVVIPDSVRIIRDWAFSGCVQLAAVEMSTATELDTFAFDSSLCDVELHNLHQKAKDKGEERVSIELDASEYVAMKGGLHDCAIEYEKKDEQWSETTKSKPVKKGSSEFEELDDELPF